MPSDEEEPKEAEKSNGEGAQPLAAVPVPIPAPPDTKTPVQFNQQVNIYQIPQSAWDKLSPQQTMELTKVILDQSDATDKRHFEFAMNQARRDDHGKRLCIWIGSFIALAGISGSSWLALHGHDLAAVSISLPLFTILAVIVGNRFLE